jgi:hypothetical protein
MTVQAPIPAVDDQNFELSLRLLTLVVVAALGTSIAFLAYRWFTPVNNPETLGLISPGWSTGSRSAKSQPDQVYECTDDGRVSFVDHPCATTPPANYLQRNTTTGN